MMIISKKAAGVVLVMTWALVVARCREAPDDEQQVRALIGDAVAAAERHDLGALMRLTAEGFVANPGSVSRREARGILLAAFKRYGRFEIRHPRPGIEIGEDRRTAAVSLPFLIMRQGATAPDLKALLDDPDGWMEGVAGLGDAYLLDLRLEKTGDGWRAVSARIRGTRGRSSL